MILTKKINSENINNSMAKNKITVITTRETINSNEGNSNNNNNSSSKENNTNSSNINGKININKINTNNKENNINSNGNTNITTNKQKQIRKTVLIIRDSMVKKIDGYLLTSSVNHKYIVKVRPFLLAKMIDMLHCIKPTQ